MSVFDEHSHALVELPEDVGQTKRIVGEYKRKSTRAIKRWMPGTVWSAGRSYEATRGREHQQNVYYYIRDKQGPGAWVWTYREGELPWPYGEPE